MLHINPPECLIDQLVTIKISELNPGQKVTVRCETIEGKFVFDSHAYFVASLDGLVDVNNDPSFGGSYKGVSQMGIFASMIPAKGQMNGVRFIPRKPMEAMSYKLQVYDDHLTEDCFKKSELLATKHVVKIPFIKEVSNLVKSPLCEDIVLRKCISHGISREVVRFGRVRGTVFKPPGPGPFKGVIDIYGGVGGINESRVALLASHGFIAFTLPHHNYDDLVKNFQDLEVEYFLEAVEYFTALDTVQPNIGILGTCAGGSISILLSTLCSNVSAVVAYNTSYGHMRELNYCGEKIECLHDYYIYSDLPKNVSYDESGANYFQGFLDHTPNDELAVKLEQSDAKFLLIVGEDDKSMNSVISARYIIKRMKLHGKGDHVTLLSYPGAGHFIDPPYMPQTMAQYWPHYKSTAAVGGNVVDNASASYHNWKQLLIFLNRNVGLPSKY